MKMWNFLAWGVRHCGSEVGGQCVICILNVGVEEDGESELDGQKGK